MTFLLLNSRNTLPAPLAASKRWRGIKSLISALYSAFLALFVLISLSAAQAAAPNIPKHVPSGLSGNDWQRALSLAKNLRDPVAPKLLQWIYATESDLPIRAADLVRFVDQNPDWPRLYLIREKIEANADSLGSSQAVADWFGKHRPRSYAGLRAALKHLPAQGQKDLARDMLIAYWRTGRLNKNQTASLAGSFTRSLTPQLHGERLDYLIWKGRYSEAQAMLAFVSRDDRLLGQTRIALAQIKPNASSLVRSLPPKLANDPAVSFERLRWRRRKNMDTGAKEMLDKMPENAPHPDVWWKEINILVRRAIEKRDYKEAYALASKRQVPPGSIGYAQAEWLLGWLALLQEKPQPAYAHFESLSAHVKSAISLSRAAFWAGEAAARTKNMPLAEAWYLKAAAYPSTFYGQLSREKIHDPEKLQKILDQRIPLNIQEDFERRELTRAVRILHKLGLNGFIDSFLAKMIAEAKTWEDYTLIARLARETERYYYAVQANKSIQQNQGHFLLGEGYPVLPPLPLQTPEKSLVHAIIYRESMFKAAAQSPAGALGLMQLMPRTAKAVAKKTSEGYNKGRLTRDPRYNVLLGSSYLKQMLDKYQGFYPMAIAAYNAGPSRVNKWIEMFGDPRKGEISTIDWIEHMPIYETRNYVQRVMEAYYMYRIKFKEKPRTITDL